MVKKYTFKFRKIDLRGLNKPELAYSFFPEKEIEGYRGFHLGFGRNLKLDQKIECETSPSNKGKCYSCRAIISKGEPRISFEDIIDKKIKNKEGKDVTLQRLDIKRLVCYKCAPRVLQEHYLNLFVAMNSHKKLIKKYKRMRRGKKAVTAIESSETINELLKEK